MRKGMKAMYTFKNDVGEANPNKAHLTNEELSMPINHNTIFVPYFSETNMDGEYSQIYQ